MLRRMKRWCALLATFVVAPISGCSDNIVRATSSDREIDGSSPLLRESLALGLVVALVLALVAVVAWMLLRKRSR